MDKKKYSILMPYHKRPQLHNTLRSFEKHYAGREDSYEVIIVENKETAEDATEHKCLLDIVDRFGKTISIKHLVHDTAARNPVQAFNMAATAAEGDFLMLTNPECYHSTDILGGLDTYYDAGSADSYIVCACLNVIATPEMAGTYDEISYTISPFYGWLQHSVHNPRLLHFCSCISKENYQAIGGFDEEYAKGISYDDDDFREKIIAANIPIIQEDNLVAHHQEHSREYIHVNMSLVAVNEAYYNSKWRT